MSDHDRERVPAEGVFEKSRQFAVSVVDILSSAAESVDAVGQRQKRPVDVGSFLHS